MWKIYLIAVFFFSGCTNFTISASMCDQIAKDPQATMPQECRNYNEKEAEKAFNKTKKKQSPEDIIEYNKE
jgi:hypothetical protein